MAIMPLDAPSHSSAFGEEPLETVDEERIVPVASVVFLALWRELNDPFRLRSGADRKQKRNQPMRNPTVGWTPGLVSVLGSEEVFHRSNQLGVEILRYRRRCRKLGDEEEEASEEGVVNWDLAGGRDVGF